MNHYTSLEQSKKLLELGLDPETADMFWAPDANIVVAEPYITRTEFEIQVPAYDGAVPCWTIGGLVEVMPDIILRQNYAPKDNICIDLTEDDPYLHFRMGRKFIGYHNADKNEYGVIFRDKRLIDSAYELTVWLLKNGYL